MTNDPHNHKGEDEKAFRTALEDMARSEREQKRRSGGAPRPATQVAPAERRRVSLLGSPAASRSSDMEPEKKRRAQSLLMP